MRKFHSAADPQYRLAAKAYEIGLVKTPYARDALYTLSAIYFLAGDTSKLLPLVQRLYAIDPMNKNTMAKLFGAWQLLGKKDSVLHYLQVAEALPFEVTVSSLNTSDKAATVEGLVTNGGAQPGAPPKLAGGVFDPEGNGVLAQGQGVPAPHAGARWGRATNGGRGGTV